MNDESRPINSFVVFQQANSPFVDVLASMRDAAKQMTDDMGGRDTSTVGGHQEQIFEVDSKPMNQFQRRALYGGKVLFLYSGAIVVDGPNGIQRVPFCGIASAVDDAVHACPAQYL
jgi:hypothetical protein